MSSLSAHPAFTLFMTCPPTYAWLLHPHCAPSAWLLTSIVYVRHIPFLCTTHTISREQTASGTNHQPSPGFHTTKWTCWTERRCALHARWEGMSDPCSPSQWTLTTNLHDVGKEPLSCGVGSHPTVEKHDHAAGRVKPPSALLHPDRRAKQ